MIVGKAPVRQKSERKNYCDKNGTGDSYILANKSVLGEKSQSRDRNKE